MAISLERLKPHAYQQLDIDDLPHRPKAPFNWQLGVPWILSAILSLLSTYLLLHQPQIAHGAYKTDFPDVQPFISYEERTFTGKFQYNKETQKIEREIDPTSPQYFGPPSPEIDAAWADLLRGEFPAMTDPEAEPYVPRLRKLPNTGHYHFELDVFHSLHCLNYVRKSLDREYYSSHLEHMESLARNSPHLPDDWGRIHLDHCLDQLVQSVLCHADLSPVPMFSWEGVPVFLGVGQTHTCRAWGPIRGWLDRRNERYTPIEEE